MIDSSDISRIFFAYIIVEGENSSNYIADTTYDSTNRSITFNHLNKLSIVTPGYSNLWDSFKRVKFFSENWEEGYFFGVNKQEPESAVVFKIKGSQTNFEIET